MTSENLSLNRLHLCSSKKYPLKLISCWKPEKITVVCLFSRRLPPSLPPQSGAELDVYRYLAQIQQSNNFLSLPQRISTADKIMSTTNKAYPLYQAYHFYYLKWRRDPADLLFIGIQDTQLMVILSDKTHKLWPNSYHLNNWSTHWFSSRTLCNKIFSF